MSRGGLLKTIKDAVDSLRLAIEELEEGSDNWEVVDDGPASSSAACVPAVPKAPSVSCRPSREASSSSFPGPRVGDPLPGDALFLVSSLHICDRRPRAERAWEAGLQAGAVLRGDQRVRVFTTFGKFKHFTGPLEGSGGLTLDWPAVPPRSCVFVPLVARQGGILAAVPIDFLDASLIAAGQPGPMDSIVGPSLQVAADLAEEQEDGSLAPTGTQAQVLLVDFNEEVASFVSRYDPVTGPVEVASFDSASPHLQLHHPELARTWIASEEGKRMAFYSAAEPAEAEPAEPGGPAPSEAPKRRPAPKPKRQTNAQLADQLSSLVEMLPMLTRQVQDLASRQTALEKKAAQPSITPAAALPPQVPAHRMPFPLSGSLELGELGLDEATGVGQQALRRLAPSEPAPQSREDMVSRRPLFTLYAERFGGFGSQRGLGIMFWLVCNILDAMVAGDHTGAEEMAALAAIAIEQAAQDAGSWDVAYLLTLMEDPPHQLFAHRPQSQNPRLRAFGGLTPQPWATTTLSYIREIDTIQSRRTEATSSKAGAQDTETPAKPKRPRFPKRPKDAAS
ncbi:unnamed protein product [Symbiodinium sp. CCMP2592]|nr:unnamed protein product [Symbiodinium sp. CCMP2592]